MSATDTSKLPPQVFTFLHAFEFLARLGGDTADAAALEAIEPTLDAAAEGFTKMLPALQGVFALVGAHVAAGKTPEHAIAGAVADIHAAMPKFDQQDGGR